MKSPLTTPRFIWRYPLVLTLMILSISCRRGIDPDSSAIVGDVYTVVDQPPIPQGGQTGLNEYVMKTIRYPAEAQRANIQGKVIVGFIVTSNGRIANVEVKQSVGGGCDEEAVRIIKGMPDWTPGQLNGKPVNVQTSLPLSFVLQ